jgi:uncharacterized protein
MAYAVRILLFIGGIIGVILGVAGIFIPLLPTTPFLLLAMFCFLRSSPRCYRWLINSRWLGVYIKHYQSGHGIPRREKALILILLWSCIGLSATTIISVWWQRLILVVIAISVTWHIAHIKTLVVTRKQKRTRNAVEQTE